MTDCPHEFEEVIATDADMASVPGICHVLTTILQYAPDPLQVVTALGVVTSAVMRTCPAEQRRAVMETYIDMLRRQVERSLMH